MLDRLSGTPATTRVQLPGAGQGLQGFHYSEQINACTGVPGLRSSPDSQRERTARLLNDEIVDLHHDHVQVFPNDHEPTCASTSGRGLNPPATRGWPRSGMTAVFDNGMDGTCCISSDAGWKYQDVLLRPRRADGRPGPPRTSSSRLSRWRTSATPTRPAG